MFRRRKSHAADVEAFHRGANANGGYDGPNEVVRPAVDRAAIELLKSDPEEYFRRTRRPIPGFLSNSPASSAVGEHRAPPSTVSIGVDGGAPSKADPAPCAPGCGPNKGGAFPDESAPGAGAGSPTSIAAAVHCIDVLQDENEYLRNENARLQSELNQAVAQLRIARAQRDEFKAQLDHALTQLDLYT